MKRLANELSARSKPIYRAAIIGLGFVGAGDQVSGDAIGGQQVSALDGTHAEALQRNTRIKLVAGSSRDLGRRERFTQRTGIKAYIAYRRLRDEISKGVLGDLTSASLRWGSGRLGNVGTHLIDALCMLTRRSVEAVSGTLDLSAKTDCRGVEFNDPGGWGVMRLSGGLMATVDAANYGAGNMQIIIYGRKACATVGRETISIEFSDGKLEQWPCLSENESSMERAVAELIEWLDGKNTFTYPAVDSVHILEAIMAFHVSHSRKSCWVELPLKGAERNYEVRSG